MIVADVALVDVEVDPARPPAVGQEEIEEGVHRRLALPRPDLGQREPGVVRARRRLADAGEVPAVEAHRDAGLRHALEEVVAEPRARVAGSRSRPRSAGSPPSWTHAGRWWRSPPLEAWYGYWSQATRSPAPAGLADRREQVGGAAPAVRGSRS